MLAPREFEPVPDLARRARWTPRLAPGAVTAYGATDPHEDIAESMRLLMSEAQYGHSFAQATRGGKHLRDVSFDEAYPARTVILERAAEADLDSDGSDRRVTHRR